MLSFYSKCGTPCESHFCPAVTVEAE